MDGTAVEFDRVSKKFRRGERHDSLRDLIPSLVKGLFAAAPPPDELDSEEFWAVDDVSFALAPGRALGVIGPNGAGKSTVLKLLTRILKPTRGACQVKGRVGALIEVAAGFHPELTGRENVFLQGAIMGMRREEVSRKLEAIVEFAGMSDFIDTPVKRYSSGMNARLGFAIAAHLDPDVLIIDEVLAVGDMAFQAKCVERMKAFKERGVAIVFVSHNLQAVSELCDEAVYLKSRVQAYGPVDSVLEAYVKSQGTPAAKPWYDVDIRATELRDEHGPIQGPVSPGAELRLRVTFEPRVDLPDATIGFVVARSTDNLVVYSGHFSLAEVGLDRFCAGRAEEIEFRLRANLLRGHYHVRCDVYDTPRVQYAGVLHPAALFVVKEQRGYLGIADLAVSGVALAPAAI